MPRTLAAFAAHALAAPPLAVPPAAPPAETREGWLRVTLARLRRRTPVWRAVTGPAR